MRKTDEVMPADAHASKHYHFCYLLSSIQKQKQPCPQICSAEFCGRTRLAPDAHSGTNDPATMLQGGQMHRHTRPTHQCQVVVQSLPNFVEVYLQQDGRRRVVWVAGSTCEGQRADIHLELRQTCRHATCWLLSSDWLHCSKTADCIGCGFHV